jgi:endonuclease/exonuclease/phosphatase family metal-dependent hydrolase
LLVLQLASAAAGPVARPALAQELPATGRVPAPAATTARPAGSLRLATYNLENLFDHVDDPSLRGEFDDMALAATDDRCRSLARAIRAVDADVLALQEVESLQALRWFRDTYLADAGYRHLSSLDAGYARGVECSVMSRFEITAERIWPDASLDDVHRDGPGWTPVPPGARLAFRRSPLQVDLRIDDDYELTVFVVHHKAQREYGWLREAEALKVVELVSERLAAHPDRNVVVMGDFNAAPWDKSFRVYLQAGLVDVMAHRGMRGAEGVLCHTHRSGRVIDYILVNGAAYREIVIDSAFVHRTATGRGGDDVAPGDYASDHFPVAVDLVPRER